MQSSDPAIYAAGDSASCQWAAEQSRHWFQMRLWSQARGRLAGWLAAVSGQKRQQSPGVGAVIYAVLLELSLVPLMPQARAMGIYAAHCMAGVPEEVGAAAVAPCVCPCTPCSWPAG